MTRREHDLLGELELPDDAPYGIHTERARRNFAVSGTHVRMALIHAYARVKWAAAAANAACGHLDANRADAIAAACQEIICGEHDDAFVLDALQGGAGTSTNMNLNEVIARRAGRIADLAVDPFDHVNLHQSTNDTYPTALKVAAIYQLQEFEAAVVELLESLQARERDFADVVKLGRTELRDAVPTTLGREFGAWATAVGRDRWRISKCSERLRVVNLGGTALGTGITAPRKYIFAAVEKLREITGLNLARAENLVDATMNHDPLVEVSGILKAHAATLVKVARDLRLLSSGPHGGLNEIDLPQLQAGSSIMPGKVNPVIPEMVMQAGFRVMAHDQEITLAVMSGELDLNPFLPLAADALLDSLQLLAGADHALAASCIDGITVHPEHCRRLLEQSVEIVTALIPRLGHDAAVRLAQHMQAKKQDVRTAVAELGLLPADELDALLTPAALCALGHR